MPATGPYCGRPTVDEVVAPAGHRAGTHRRTGGGLPGQPAPVVGRHPGHRRLAEGRPVRAVLRLVQPAVGDPGGHTGIPARQGPRVAGDDPPRGGAGVRLRRGHSAPGVRDPAQGVRWGPHRDGLEGPGKRSVLRLARRRNRGDGGRRGGADPQPEGPARGTRGTAGRVRRAVPHPVEGSRTGVRRCGDRSRGHPDGGGRRARCTADVTGGAARTQASGP
jgi:hypothetical protein